jgi:hypothetical protein
VERISTTVIEGQANCIRETYDAARDLFIGLLVFREFEQEKDSEFRDWAETLFLLETRFQPLRSMRRDSATEMRQVSEHISDIFDRTIRNAPERDEWRSTGKSYFVNQISAFVEKDEKIQFCLPAFPCKSPNMEKVSNKLPDAAECIALDILRYFIQEIRKIYKPSAVLWIVSDGHVFSDCSKSAWHED